MSHPVSAALAGTSSPAAVLKAQTALAKLRDSVGALNSPPAMIGTQNASRAMDFLASRNDELGREVQALKVELGSRAASRGKY